MDSQGPPICCPPESSGSLTVWTCLLGLSWTLRLRVGDGGNRVSVAPFKSRLSKAEAKDRGSCSWSRYGPSEEDLWKSVGLDDFL